MLVELTEGQEESFVVIKPQCIMGLVFPVVSTDLAVILIDAWEKDSKVSWWNGF